LEVLSAGTFDAFVADAESDDNYENKAVKDITSQQDDKRRKPQGAVPVDAPGAKAVKSLVTGGE
jgi:hypothetical protein